MKDSAIPEHWLKSPLLVSALTAIDLGLVAMLVWSGMSFEWAALSMILLSINHARYTRRA